MRSRITLLYLLTASMLVPIIYLLNETSSAGMSSQLSQASHATAAACAELKEKFVAGADAGAFASEGEAKFQDALLEIILSRYEGVEGGFWSEAGSFQGYAYPTYDGASPKKDVPRSEMGSLAALGAQALRAQAPAAQVREGKREAVVSYACPVPRTRQQTAAWTLMRVPISSGAEFDQLRVVALALLGLLLITGVFSIWLLRSWAQDLRRLQNSIGERASDADPLPASREPDLQKIVRAFNAQSERLRGAHEESLALSRRLSQAERLALLGQMAAGIAHEIRNPIAAMKLKLENAEVHPAERMPKALPIVMEQIGRVDRLVEMLLSISRPFLLHFELVPLKAWLEEGFLAPRARAAERNVAIELNVAVEAWRFDRFHLGRAVENILQNAVEFSPPGSAVRVNAAEANGKLVLEIADSGAGVPANLKSVLFQPFASAREGGLGLGLILAKEIVEAHGGALSEVGDAGGACFRVEVPWPKS